MPDITDLEGLERFLTKLLQDPGSHALPFMAARRKSFAQSAYKSSEFTSKLIGLQLPAVRVLKATQQNFHSNLRDCKKRLSRDQPSCT